ncbi:ATP-binding cassette domain-containing protein [uncultured Ilumatobacter sp.]|uniref:ABC transporter ATP-binding protein n=1 Tax=uncultured Ilumatobacter sp. TaxID=879968 RepID=UPI00374FB580
MAAHDGFSLRGVAAGPAEALILRDITVDIPNAGITAIVGPSGSGKSTLLRLLNRLDDPLAGEIRLRGQRLDELRPDELRRQVAMVFQRPPLFAGSVLDNFRVAMADIDEDRAFHVLDHVGLPAGLLHREAADLSGGEAQRMCVARALLTRPMVVLADEPTAALDGEARNTIEELAQQLADEGTPLVWVSHDTAQLRRLADHVLAIVDGQVAAFGHLSDLDASDDPVVRRLVGAP